MDAFGNMRKAILLLAVIALFATPLFSFPGIQFDAPWNLARLSHRFYQYPLATEYDYSATGRGVNVYIVDTGILIAHLDFEGRASSAFDSNKGRQPDFSTCNGHGTHVAGTVGSRTYGVAKGVNLLSVRVYPCWGSGRLSDMISGLEYVRKHARIPAVVLMSDSGPADSQLDAEVQLLIDRGITVVVAAGNFGTDACNYSPSRIPDAITVGSTDQRDFRDSISNYGPCVDLYAPGVLITSTWNDGGIFVMSGTSTAAPHVAGLAALYLETHPFASPKEVRDAIVTNATPGIVTDGDPDLFASVF